jgi:mRNA-degrading endonuclease HigB of HigAB toxin-antitoxin module
VRILNRAAIVAFRTKHEDVEGPLRLWFSIVEGAKWSGPPVLRAAYGGADFLTDNRVFFDIRGIRNRIVAQIEIPPPDPVKAITFRMEALGLSRHDLEPHIGSRARVSEVLTRKRSLTLAMIRNLHQNLGIPAEILIGEPRPLRKVASVPIRSAKSRRPAQLGVASRGRTRSRSSARK